MKRHLNTLFVTTQDVWLAKEGECVALFRERKLMGKIPLHTLEAIVCFGRISASPYLLGHCAECGVSVAWMTEQGRFLATVNGPTSGNVLLRRNQYRMADSPLQSAELARAFTIGKIANYRTNLLRRNRDYPSPLLEDASRHLASCLERLQPGLASDSVRGIEGEAARVYFGAFPAFIAGGTGLSFNGRSRRPPQDEINALLSFLYALLVNDVRGALESAGLDSAVGFLHRDRPGRPGLALDVMEEFRPYLADRLALTLINRRQITAGNFVCSESGGYTLKDDARKVVLTAWQERKREIVEHPFLKEKMSVGLLWHMQARLLARRIRGEMDAYPPVLIR